MNGAEAYKTGDFTRQAQALDYNLRALDDQLLSYTLWNYTPDNSNARLATAGMAKTCPSSAATSSATRPISIPADAPCPRSSAHTPARSPGSR